MEGRLRPDFAGLKADMATGAAAGLFPAYPGTLGPLLAELWTFPNPKQPQQSVSSVGFFLFFFPFLPKAHTLMEV